MLEAVEHRGLEPDIQKLATQFAVSPAEVHEILWGELQQLEQAARIRDFVPLLAIKHAKELLRSRMAISRRTTFLA